MRIKVDRKSEVADGYKAERARGLFNVSEQDGSEFHLEADLPIEDGDWNIGIVVGSSGSGKSSIGAELIGVGFKEWTGGRWSKTAPILEEVPGSFDAATGVLSTVGLGSVPAWLRPYSVLSNGEKFRASCAKLIAEEGKRGLDEVLIDEFTSVLDRTVACTGSAAFARAWRKRGGRLVLLTCHHDILDWVEPDWVFDTDRQQLYYKGLERTQLDERKYKKVGVLVVKK